MGVCVPTGSAALFTPTETFSRDDADTCVLPDTQTHTGSLKLCCFSLSLARSKKRVNKSQARQVYTEIPPADPQTEAAKMPGINFFLFGCISSVKWTLSVLSFAQHGRGLLRLQRDGTAAHLLPPRYFVLIITGAKTDTGRKTSASSC